MKEKTKNIVVVALCALFLFGFALFCWFKPADDYSTAERRSLKQFPELSFESVKSGDFMKSFESYSLDQFPLRDTFRSIKVFSAVNVMRQMSVNDIYERDGYVAKVEYPTNISSAEYAASRFGYVYDSFIKEKGGKVYLSVIPDKNYFMSRKYGRLSLDYDALITALRENMTYAEYIDIFPCLELSDYYMTDTHWSQEKIFDVAQTLGQAMGVKLTEEYTVKTLENDFYGVYAGQYALPLKPDTIKYLESDSMKDWIVTNWDSGKAVQMPVYNMEKAHGPDPYEMFLSGPLSLITIENPNAASKKELIIFRDSYGNSLSPLLADGYSKVTLVDIRYLEPRILGFLKDNDGKPVVNFDGADVLFVYSTLVLNNSNTLR